MRLTRADRSLVAEWWFTVDRQLLAVLLVLIGTGLALAMAASPAVAVKKGLAPFYFAERQLLFGAVGIVVMLAVSAASPRLLRRIALGLLLASIGLMIWVAVAGPEIKGARRWVHLAGHSFQPSEIGKPALIVIVAWLFSEGARRSDIPALAIAVGISLIFAILLAIQPDIGQTVLVAMVWGALLLMSGQPVRLALMLVPVGVAGFGVAWLAFEHVRIRLARFLDPASGDTYQTDRAMQSFAEGGFLGRGPGEGTIKSVLPDAHTDFIFAVIGEEYGAVACLALLGLFAFVAVRAFQRAWGETDAFVRLASVGLAMLLVLQAVINMAVNVGLLPAKGMTLPFISAGGSSSLAASLTAGMLLGLTRRRPGSGHVKKPQLRPTMGSVAAR